MRTPEDRFIDIIDAADKCIEYSSRRLATEERSVAQDAILFQLAVIGEAAQALPESLRLSSAEDIWTPARSLRNFIIHEYFRIDPELIMDVVRTHLPDFTVKVLRYAWAWHIHVHSREPINLPACYWMAENDRWFWGQSEEYLLWISESLTSRIVARERDRFAALLEQQLLELVSTPWSRLYDGPDSFRDPDSDYGYLIAALDDLESESRHLQKLWEEYEELWQVNNWFWNRCSEINRLQYRMQKAAASGGTPS